MMNIKNKIGLIMTSLMLLMSSCTSETEITDFVESPKQGVENKVGSFCFSLGGSICNGAATRADDEGTEGTTTKEDDEKTVTSLLAVIFQDKEVAADVSNGATKKEMDDDPYVGYIDVSIEGGKFVGQMDYFQPYENGDYLICFIANPGSDLKAKIENLVPVTNADESKTISTVETFKALQQIQAPENTNSDGVQTYFAMTSAFYCAHIDDCEAKLGEVRLTRMMARIDIVNNADNITITGAKFTRRAVKSVLITDAPEYSADYINEDTYTFTPALVGSSEDGATGNTCESLIYSYEQYGQKDNEIPVIELSYYVGTNTTKTYTHKVTFTQEKTVDKVTETVPLELERNHQYRIVVTNEGNKFRFSVMVKAWDKSEEDFVVLNQTLVDNISDYPEPEVGFLMLANGKFMNPQSYNASNVTDETKAIGVVAYLYPVDDSYTMPSTQKVSSKKGLVLALRDASTGTNWSSSTGAFTGTMYTTVKSAYNGKSGYALCSSLKSNTNCLAGAAARDYDIASAPTGTSGWYLPSLGEWILMMGSNGIGGGSKVDGFATEESTGAAANSMTDFLVVYNNAVTKVGVSGTDYDPITSSYWSVCEYNSYNAWWVKMGTSSMNVYTVDYGTSGTNKTVTSVRVRSILAF